MGLTKFDYQISCAAEEAIYRQCENPVTEIWREFLLFREVIYLKRVWPNSTDSLRNYVSASIEQSYQYIKASEVTDLNIKPLLLYYAFLNLTKAVLTIRLGEIATDYHGLCKPNEAADFIDFSVTINDGVFHQLGQLMGYKHKKNDIVSLRDFFSSAIELKSSFERFFNTKSNIVTIDVQRMAGGWVGIYFNKNIFSKEMIDSIPSFLDDFIFVEDNDKYLVYNIKIEIEDGSENVFRIADPIINKYIEYSVLFDNKHYLNLNLGKSSWMPQVICYLGALYVLSTIVRYHPVLLSENLKSENGCKWLIQDICEKAARCLPNLLLNEMYCKRFKYHTFQVR